MHLQRLWLTDFRSYPSVELNFAPGLTALLGANGQGKTNIMEAVASLATMSSFRGAPTDALIRRGATSASLAASRPASKVQINKQRLARTRDLLGALRVSVFSPDDLELVKGGPAERRRYLDDAVVSRRPSLDVLRTDLDRILRQRNALLRQSGGRLSPEIEATLLVWDAKLVATGEALADARLELIGDLSPALGLAYDDVAGEAAHVQAVYEAPWRDHGLAAALEAVRRDELRRGTSLVGPHRDELLLTIDGMPSRTHASQGEQRSLALALRLAAHRVVTEATGTPPILLLDDVFSELDPDRSWALLAHLPPGQTLLSSAIGLPPGAHPEQILRIEDGTIRTS